MWEGSLGGECQRGLQLCVNVKHAVKFSIVPCVKSVHDCSANECTYSAATTLNATSKMESISTPFMLNRPDNAAFRYVN